MTASLLTETTYDRPDYPKEEVSTVDDYLLWLWDLIKNV